MQNHLLTGVIWLASLLAAPGTLFYQGASPDSGGTFLGAVANPTIVDGNPAYISANTMTISGLGSSLSSLTLALKISGGHNNGLHAYLVHGSTTMTLFNQPGVVVDGFGALGSGMNISLLDGASDHGSIQSETSGSVLSGSYNAAGSLAGFNGGDPNGSWTLYFADTLGGGGNATLNGWSLELTAVPEPINGALAILAGLIISVKLTKLTHTKFKSRLSLR
jgi:hypothetical protein